jgi:hypothetical protein
MENLSFLDALKILKEKGDGYRAHPGARPGVLIWLVNGTVESNLPVQYEDYLSNDWCVIQDETIIR